MRAIFLSFLFVACYCIAEAQPVYQLTGARAAGMGGAAAPVGSIWSVQYNISALAELSQPEVALGYQTRFNLPELSTAALVAGMPLTFGIAGLSLSRYGFGAYHLQEASLGFAHQLEFVSLGLQMGMVQAATEGFGSYLSPILSMGGTARLLPRLQFGGYVYNITQSKINSETGEHLPTILRAGLQWKPTTLVMLLAETEKDVDYPARFKAGIEYQLRPVLALRTGFSTNPVNLHAGVGLKPGRYTINYALEHHRYLGNLHHVSVGMRLKDQP